MECPLELEIVQSMGQMTEEIMAAYACYAKKLGATIIGGAQRTLRMMTKQEQHSKQMADALKADNMECPLELDCNSTVNSN